VIAAGTLEQVAEVEESATGQYLRRALPAREPRLLRRRQLDHEHRVPRVDERLAGPRGFSRSAERLLDRHVQKRPRVHGGRCETCKDDGHVLNENRPG
jgi:hypothetical protein